MHPSLDEWDETYLKSLATAPESVTLEKKAADKFDPDSKKGETREELAKQVCAFANAQGGYLVYGIDNDGNFDDGVEATINREPVKAWVEALIPKLLQPPVHGCQARFISIDTRHKPNRGILIVSIPLSELRPHYVHGSNTAFIRAGEHSAPMALQTFLDISSRGTTHQGSIVGLGIISGPDLVESPHGWHLMLNPIVRIESGPLCLHWALHLKSTQGRIRGWLNLPKEGNVIEHRDGELIYFGTQALFPRVERKVSTSDCIMIADGGTHIEATLCLESSFPVRRVFTWAEIIEGKGRK